jgi:very-short-patch-repair endonuclease
MVELQEVAAGRAEAIARAVRVWTGQLVDLTARNNLLYYKDLKVGTLDLAGVPPELLFDVLGGKSTLLSRLFGGQDARADAVKRARAVRNRAQEHFEERGLETLYLACGMATWTNQRGTATPSAPVLLVPARLASRGAAQDDFELSVTGELEVNPTLLQLLQSDFDCRCDPEELLAQAGIEGAVDTPKELDSGYRWLAERASEVPDFGVTPRFVLGTFSYAKLPMVKDLEGSVEAMAAHDLIAALAGDEQAQAAVRERRPAVDARAPDHIPPADEFLVVDADASQNYAINAVLGGQDLIIKGPPGTGKSQTIANLVSTLVARGQRVLFVAEKRAAIDAVLRRLDGVGLSDLILDLHGATSSRRQVAQQLASALATNSSLIRPDHAAEQRLLQARRDELNGRVEALHTPRQPWNLSVFGAQARLLGLDPTVQTTVRFRGQTLARLDERAHEATAENLRSYADLGGLALASSPSPWARARIVSVEQAQAAQALVDRLYHQTLPSIVARLQAAAADTGLRPPGTVEGWAQTLALLQNVRGNLDVFAPEIYEAPLDELLPLLAPLGEGPGKRFGAWLTSSPYRRTRKHIKGLMRPGVSVQGPKLLSALTETRDEKRHWRASAADEKPPTVPDDLDGLIGSFAQLRTELDELAGHLGEPSLDGSVDELRARLHALLGDPATLVKLPELHRLWSALHDAGLDELLADLATRGMAPSACADAFAFAWLSSVIEDVSFQDPRIGAFDGAHHSRVVAEYQAADRRHIETTAQRVRRRCAEEATRVQDEHPQQAALIRDQAARKRKHLSVRQLFSGAPDVMTALKPCWAMSPLLVSQLLPSDRPYFDVVVFDEANQLPPTDFFAGANPDTEEDPEAETRIVMDSRYESVLNAMTPFIDFRMLRWHYRSRDERLISFSNVYVYDRGLTTFPGVLGSESIQHVLVPYTHGAGSAVSSRAEVDRVVELILEHAETRPRESLGVITMGLPHKDRIDDALRGVLRERDDLGEFFDESRNEPFFTKNLERVQGDERDAIILSVGYCGRNADGQLRYNFGPLNDDGGERRLNVAVTRAKNRMTLVSSFSSLDMDPDRSSKEGIKLLRLYLQYAESGGEDLGPQATFIPELNPFEVDVRDTLEQAGVPLCAQYGASGFRIDFAAKHPTQPGRMVLAIECDGASYHSSQTARDRDRLRQDQLQRLGWTFHRIWSTDWFRNKDKETEKTLAAYHAAVSKTDAEVTQDGPPAQERDPQEAPRRRDARPTAPERPPRPPVQRFRNIDEYTQADLQAIVRWIESDTLLRTQDQLLIEVIHDLGFARRGRRIVDAINAAIESERGSTPADRR